MFRFVKDCLTVHLKPHIQSKAIICSSSAASLQVLQPCIDDWMDSDDDFKGDTVLVIGDQETELKLVYTVAFPTKISKEEQIDNNIFYPWIILGTS